MTRLFGRPPAGCRSPSCVEANSRRADIDRAMFVRAGVIVGAVVAIFRLLDWNLVPHGDDTLTFRLSHDAATGP